MSLSVFKSFQKRYLPKSFKGKIMFIAFAGIHVPLLGLLGYITLSQLTLENGLNFLIVALIATLVGTAITLWLLSQLLKPIEYSSQALSQYNSNRTLPSLPTKFNDEAGLLMAQTQYSIEQLDKLLTFKNDLISVISHDARTPVSSILIAQELIEQKLDEMKVVDEDIRLNLELIKKSATHHLDALENMLEMTQIESTDLELIKKHITLDDLFKDVQQTHKIQAISQNITLNFQTNSLESKELYVDPTKMKSILNNLVSNALKYTPEKGIITLTAQQNEGNLYLRVSDTGVGIEKSDLETIFNRNYSTPSLYNSNSGNGLGLWICKKFTELHKGTISIRSKPEVGTTFSIALPIRNVYAED